MQWLYLLVLCFVLCFPLVEVPVVRLVCLSCSIWWHMQGGVRVRGWYEGGVMAHVAVTLCLELVYILGNTPQLVIFTGYTILFGF